MQEEEMKRLQRSGKYQYYFKFQKKRLLLKMTLQLVVSVALLSLFLCYSSSSSSSSSSGFHFFPHSFNVYFFTLLFSVFTRTLERKYMFLICNGILVLLARTSVSGDSRHQNRDLISTVVVGDEMEVAAEETVNYPGDNNIDDDREKLVMEEPLCKGEKVEDQAGEEVEDEGGESQVSVVVEDVVREEEIEGRCGAAVPDVAEDVVADASEEVFPSTEELNRKIEEFIRKMKEEIRIEAQQQLAVEAL